MPMSRESMKREFPYDPHPQRFTPVGSVELGTGVSGCDLGIIKLVQRLNQAGYRTAGSCSGLTADHRKQPQHSYLWFIKTDKETRDKIVKAGEDADLLVLYHGAVNFDYGKTKEYEMMEIRSPRRPKSDEEIHQAWKRFEDSLLGGK